VSRPKILVVDDSPLALAVVRGALPAGEYEVATASTGEAALAQIPQLQPDLLLLDVYMPGLDGLALCQQLRRNPATRTLPIVLLSTQGSIADKAAGFRVGADDYLLKAYDLSDLPYRLACVLRQRAGTRPVD
jgi:DNA-binding response OmpR family regulator